MYNQTLLCLFTGYEYTQEMFLGCIHYNVMSWYFEECYDTHASICQMNNPILYKRYSDLWHEDVVILVWNAMWNAIY